MSEVKAGDKVQVHYTGKFEDGEIFDSSDGREPLAFSAGGPELIPGVSNAVVGMKVGDKKSVTIQPDDGYGPRNEEMVQQVPMDRMPEGVQVGMQLQAQVEGQVIPLVVTAVTTEYAEVDANHPLAGKTLVFDLELVSID